MSDFESALTSSLNLFPSFANALTANAFNLLGFTDQRNPRTTSTINLETLNNFAAGNEHDASLSRLDRKESIAQSKSGELVLTDAGTPKDTLVPNEGLIQHLLSDVDGPFVSTRSLGLSRLRRDTDSLAAGSPPLREGDAVAAVREAGLIIQFLGEGGDPQDSDSTGQSDAEIWDQRLAKKDKIAEWFTRERFPREWERTGHQVTAQGDMIPLAARVIFWRNWWDVEKGKTVDTGDDQSGAGNANKNGAAQNGTETDAAGNDGGDDVTTDK
jgi:hypothetical protein